MKLSRKLMQPWLAYLTLRNVGSMTRLETLILSRGENPTRAAVEVTTVDEASIINNLARNLSLRRTFSTLCSLARSHNTANREVDKDTVTSRGNINRMQMKENFSCASSALSSFSSV